MKTEAQIKDKFDQLSGEFEALKEQLLKAKTPSDVQEILREMARINGARSAINWIL